MILAENKVGIQLVQYLDVNEDNLSMYESVSSAFAIVVVNNKLLLGLNNWRRQWEIPAGKIEIGETAREAAVRELFEETHQIVEKLYFKGLFKIYDTNKDEFRHRAVFVGELTCLLDFICDSENDEMDKILLWDRKENIGYIDEVDLKMVEMALDFADY